MASKSRGIIGILIITVVFLGLSIVSLSGLFNNMGTGSTTTKKEYFTKLESELNITFESDDEFANFSLVEYELFVEPTKYKNHYKPCFNFVITDSGVVVKNALSKEYYDNNFKSGMLITHINDIELKGKGYFEILELLYSISKVEKTFKLDTLEEIKYTYGPVTDRLYYDEVENRLYVYNLDKITQKAIYDYATNNPNMILDLSMATINTYDGLYDFVSLFVSSDELLFLTPEGIYAKDNFRKIAGANIYLGDNTDNGVLFAITTIKRFNKNVTSSVEVKTTEFYALNTLSITGYNIYLKNIKVELKDLSLEEEI